MDVMAESDDFLEFLTDQLSTFDAIEIKKMFGGYGFFKEGLMFGMVGNDSFRLKVDDTNKEDYIVKGMEPFQSASKKKGMPYWEVPQDILEDKAVLAKWAKKSFAIAKAAKKK